MLVDLKALAQGHGTPFESTAEERHIAALIAIAERLDRLCDLVERAQRPDGTLKREIRL